MEFSTSKHTMTIPPNVATIGFFDGVHHGHQFLIDQVVEESRKSSLSSLLVTFEKHPREVMHADFCPELLSTVEEKRALLSQTTADYCAELTFDVEMSRLTSKEFMAEVLSNQLNVKTLIIGYDHRFGRNRQEGFDDYVRFGRELGMSVLRADGLVIEDVPVSSSAGRRLGNEGDVCVASTLRGREY